MSLISQFFASRLGRYVIGVFVAWILLFAIGYVFRDPTPGHPVLHVFAGFLLGMLSMYIATRIYAAPQDSSRAWATKPGHDGADRGAGIRRILLA